MRRILEALSHLDMVLQWFGSSLPVALGALAGMLWSGEVVERIVVGVAVFAFSFAFVWLIHRVSRRNVRVLIRRRWEDLGGPFCQDAGDGYVRRVHSLHTDIEITNHGNRQLTATRAVLECLTPRVPYLRKREMQWLTNLVPLTAPGMWTVFAEAPVYVASATGEVPMPKVIDGRIDFTIPADSPPKLITVEFEREWAVGARDAPRCPGLFDSMVRIEFTDGKPPERIVHSPKSGS